MSGIPVFCAYDEMRDPRDLIGNPRNPNSHPDAQIKLLAHIIDAQGWRAPITVSKRSGYVVRGHGRLAAALLLGTDEVPVDVQEYADDASEWADMIADNRIAELAEIERDVLKDVLEEMDDGSFDMLLTGYDDSELERMMTATHEVTEDEAPEPPADPITKPGDLWLLGEHRVLCGDSTKAEDVARLMDGITPDIANCDPPYGVSIVNSAGGVRGAGDYPYGGLGSVGGAKAFGAKGRVHGPSRRAIIKPGVYSPIIGDDSTDTAVASYERLTELGVPVIVMWGGNYYADKLPASRCWLVWDKENTGSFADGELAWTNLDATVKILRHQWSGLIKASERGEKRVHPTQKPVALAQWVIETCAPDSKTVLDLFLGSGWTLAACEQTGRTCYGMEMAPAYCDVIVTRWENLTGRKAVLDGQTAEGTESR